MAAAVEEKDIYVLYYENHTDCYKRGGSATIISGLFYSEEAAYEKAVKSIYMDENVISILLVQMEPQETWKETYQWIMAHEEQVYGRAEYTSRASGEYYYVEKFYPSMISDAEPSPVDISKEKKGYYKWLRENESEVLNTPLVKWLKKSS